MIPKVITFIWIGCGVSDWVRWNIDRWAELNPDFEIRLRDEEVLHEDYAIAYQHTACGIGAKRPNPPDMCSLSDLLRLSVLKSGGWYVDCDFIPIQPWRTVYENYDLSQGCFLTQQWAEGPKRINNGIIGITEDSPVWSWIDKYVEEVAATPEKIERTSFGPLMASRLVTEVPQVVVGSTHDFYSIRFNPKGAATRVLETLVEKDFSKEAIQEIWHGKPPHAFHLWAGGDYSKLMTIPKEVEPVLDLPVVVTCARQYTHTYREVSNFVADVKELIPGVEICVYSDMNLDNLPIKRVDIVHKDWPAWASKMEIFRDFSWGEKRVLYLDPRIQLTGSLSPLLRSDSPFVMMCGIKKKSRRRSGIMSWVGDWSDLYVEFRGSDMNKAVDAEFIAERTDPAIFQDIVGSSIDIKVWKENER